MWRSLVGRATAVRVARILRRSEIRSAALELAVALSVPVLLAIGVADFGRMFFTGRAVANAARAAAEARW